MEEKCILSKKALLFLCIIESWIKQFQKEKKVTYIVLMDIIFAFPCSLLLAIVTYFLIVLFIIISTEKKLEDFFYLIYLSSFLKNFVIYFVVLLVVSLQNLFNENFNIANKVKLLILALFQDIKFNKWSVGLFFFGWIVLTIILCTIFDPYVGTIFINDVEIKNIMFASMIFSFIIIFLILVYGIEDPIKSSRRKIVIYGISTIITFSTTLNSISKIINGQEFAYVTSIEFISLVLVLIISVDRLALNLKTTIEKYDERFNCTNCKSCVVEKYTYIYVVDYVKSMASEKINQIKLIYHDIKGLSKIRKMVLLISISFLLLLCFNPDNIEKWNLIMNQYGASRFHILINFFEDKFNFNMELIGSILFKIIMVLFVILIIIVGISCIGLLLTRSICIFRLIKYRRIIKTSHENLDKVFVILEICSLILATMCMLSFGIINILIIKLILKLLAYIFIIILCLAFISRAAIKAKIKISEYKKK